MTLRCTAVFSLLLFAATSGSCAAAVHGAQPAEPVLATPAVAALSVDLRAVPVWLQPARQTLLSMVSSFYASTTAHFTTLSTSSSIAESLDALPVIGTMRRRTGRRFNTDDASVDDFAICYRLSSRLGFQIIPGDPAPVKLAVTSVANNTGVTFGMTWKLPRR